jgi:hypothetical protein
MTKNYPEFARKLVPVCLLLMSEREDDPEWLKTEAIQDDEDIEGMASVAEESLDRLAQKLGAFLVVVAALFGEVPMANKRPCLSWCGRRGRLPCIRAEPQPDASIRELATAPRRAQWSGGGRRRLHGRNDLSTQVLH